MSVPPHAGRGLRRARNSGNAANAAALRFAEKAVQIGGQNAFNRYALGQALTLVRRHDEAVFEFGKAIEFEPSFAQAHDALGMALATSGRPKEALPHIDLAMRLSPQDPYFGQLLVRRAEAYLFMGRLRGGGRAVAARTNHPIV
jgi:adenylate cyclase